MRQEEAIAGINWNNWIKKEQSDKERRSSGKKTEEPLRERR